MLLPGAAPSRAVHLVAPPHYGPATITKTFTGYTKYRRITGQFLDSVDLQVRYLPTRAPLSAYTTLRYLPTRAPLPAYAPSTRCPVLLRPYAATSTNFQYCCGRMLLPERLSGTELDRMLLPDPGGFDGYNGGLGQRARAGPLPPTRLLCHVPYLLRASYAMCSMRLRARCAMSAICLCEPDTPCLVLTEPWLTTRSRAWFVLSYRRTSSCLGTTLAPTRSVIAPLVLVHCLWA
eukprot:518011-Rhodomonas_salina.1